MRRPGAFQPWRPFPGSRPGRDARGAVAATGPGIDAFTLIELLLAVVIFALVLAAIQLVFHGALRLRAKTVANLAASLPLQQALSIVQHDLANLVVPGGRLSGSLQTTPNSAANTNATTPTTGMRVGQVGPFFYTSAGIMQDLVPWAEVEKIAYRLVESTNNTPGMDLVRSVTRNLLPPVTEEFEDQFLLEGVDQLTFKYYDGTQWQDEWDSSAAATVLPEAIKVEVLLASSRTNILYREPIQIVVPILVQAAQGETAGASSGGEAP